MNINEQDVAIDTFFKNMSNVNDPYTILFSKIDKKYLHFLKETKEINIVESIKNIKKSVVISIDIRNSTNLMEQSDLIDYSEFTEKFVEKTIECIKKNYGIIDRFTGDGILAFFPDFYAGKDSCGFALNSAITCHSIFESISKSRDLKTGFGIGIDYGDIIIRFLNQSVHIMGLTAVHACRIGGIDAGKTAVTKNVYMKLQNLINSSLFYEKEIETKSGKMSCYSVKYKMDKNKLELPKWNK